MKRYEESATTGVWSRPVADRRVLATVGAVAIVLGGQPCESHDVTAPKDAAPSPSQVVQEPDREALQLPTGSVARSRSGGPTANMAARP